ncbi:MAG: hypothetical protein CK546_02065 [Pedosphaera sp.]|nr:MAG: hypothetical protein CK546_02065 [Pedosphaera sp.]
MKNNPAANERPVGRWKLSFGRWTFALLLSTFSPQLSTRADSVTLRPIADTTLIETAPNNNLGAQPFANSGTTQNFTKNRALFRFDVSGIPTGAQVDSVSIAFEVTRQPVDGYAPADFGLHRMLVSWGEGAQTTANPGSPGQGAPAAPGEATWLARFAQTGPNWAAPGGLAATDFAAASSAGQSIYSVANSPYFFTSSQLAADVQLWLANPSENFGWMLLANDEGPNFTARRFGSREDAINAPQLLVQFTTVPEPSALVLLAGGVVLLARRVRRN